MSLSPSRSRTHLSPTDEQPSSPKMSSQSQAAVSQPAIPQPDEQPPKEGESSGGSYTTTMTTDTCDFIALRTVPIYVSQCGSMLYWMTPVSKSYLNGDVAAELGLVGIPTELNVNVLNNNTETLDTTTVDLYVESNDHKVRQPVTAYITDRVTGNLKVIDWNKEKPDWSHLRRFKFPKLGKRPIVDMLIGSDQADMHFSIQDVKGNPGEPIARLTPLGWTCIGSPYADATRAQSHYTFFQQDSGDLSQLVRMFWELEEIQSTVLVKPDEKLARNIVADSMTYGNGHYSVGMPWKPVDHPSRQLQDGCPLSREYRDAAQEDP